MSGESNRAGKAWSTIFEYSRTNRLRVVAAAAAMMAAVAFVDLALGHVPVLGYLYIIPLVVVAGFLKRWQVLIFAVLSALLREIDIEDPWYSVHLARASPCVLDF